MHSGFALLKARYRSPGIAVQLSSSSSDLRLLDLKTFDSSLSASRRWRQVGAAKTTEGL
jgi:hypothetical protein